MTAGAMVAFSGCNSSDTPWNNDPANYSGTQITSFNLKADKAILNNLDSVFFSIDLIDARIFNANPLPCDTKTEALKVKLNCDECRVIQFIVPAAGEKPEQTLDYLADQNVAIDFSRGPVKLHMVAADGLNTRDYQVSVNVYSEVTDSLYWDKVNAGKLKGVPGMTRSKTVKVGDNALTLSTAPDGSFAITTFIPSPTTGSGQWAQTMISPAFPAHGTLDTNSFTATANGTLFVTDNNGQLYMSTDGGHNFSMVDSNWEAISAPYEDGIIGVKNNAGNRTYAAYPPSVWPTAGAAVANRFPVEGYSAAASFSTKWARKPQVVITGGKNAAGSYTGTWAFDGSRWIEVSNVLPEGTGWQMTEYTIAETDTINWQTSRKNVLIAFGGRIPQGISSETWISRDMGVNWSRGSKYLQLPAYILPLASDGSLLVFDKLLTEDGATTLAVKPITEWECPYLYIFGGYDISDRLRDQYWSGVVNHLKAKPLQ